MPIFGISVLLCLFFRAVQVLATGSDFKEYYVQLVYLNRVYTARGSDFKEGMASENTDKDAICSNVASFSIKD